MQHHRSTSLLVLLVLPLLGLGACTATSEPERASATSDAVGSACGAYPAKPACDPGAVVDYVWAHKKETLGAVSSCAGCASALVAAGGVIVGSGGSAAPVVVSGALVMKAIGTVVACADCVEFSRQSGLVGALGCEADHVLNGGCQYTPEAQQTECTQSCRGIGQYGYTSGTLCNCTSDPNEAACAKQCPSWTRLAPAPDCGCYTK